MQTTFAGRNIVVGVTGSIACFKVAGWVSALTKEEALVDVIMSGAAQQFVAPLTFSSLSGRRVYTDMFTDDRDGTINHIALAREADCILIAPATAHTMARLAHGMADDLLSATVLAATVPILICPAMNSKMYEHPATRRNMQVLRELGYSVVEPETGAMACGEFGSGRLPEWEVVAEYLMRSLTPQDLAGQVVLVTAGPTREPIDPARYLSNRSSGKMGYALARSAFRRGARVLLISGPTNLACPPGVQRIDVTTARQMHDAVMAHYQEATVIIKAAAVADFRSKETFTEKIKKDQASLVLALEPNPDILKALGALCDHDRQLLVGFAAESAHFAEEGRKKLHNKQCDLIAVNDIGSDRTGFASDGNRLLVLDNRGSMTEMPYASKARCADLLWDHIVTNGFLRA